MKRPSYINADEWNHVKMLINHDKRLKKMIISCIKERNKIGKLLSSKYGI